MQVRHCQIVKLILCFCLFFLLISWRSNIFFKERITSFEDCQQYLQEHLGRSVSRNLSDQHQQDFQDATEQPLTVHMGAVSYGAEYAMLVIVTIKTILLLTDANLHWYVFTTDNATEIIMSDVTQWPESFRSRLMVSEVPLTCDKWHMYFNNKTRPLRGMAIKPCVLTGIEHSIVKDYTDKMIFIDLDTFIVDDIVHLWNRISMFTEDHIMSLDRADFRYIMLGYSKYSYDLRYGINSGVVLINLKHMAGFNFEDKYIECSKQKVYYTINETDSIYNKDDQNVLNVLFYKYPYKILPLSCNWNYRISMDHTCEPGHSKNCDESISQGVSLIHSYSGSRYFLKTDYAAVYNCTQMIDLDYVDDAVRCLHRGIASFKTNRVKVCLFQVNNLRPLETALKKHHPNV